MISSGAIIFLQVSVLVFVLSPPTNCLSLNDRLQLEDYIDNKIKGLAANAARLETLIAENYVKKTTMNEMLLANDARLEELELKMIRLEEKELDQNLLIEELQKERDLYSSIRERSLGRSVSFPRTCRELRSADPTLTSGMHWIDPDGQGIGDDPIYVYCDMTKGATSILHDSELPTDVGHCADPGCYSRAVRYRNATMRQMIALADLSSECHQTIQYDCNFAPLELNGVTYSSWNDRNGVARYFWAGSNSSVHTCQCGIDHNCIESSVTCNCDSAAPVPLTDAGVINDKSFLPITWLNFGRTQLATSSGVHTLGRFECTGQVAVSGRPTSCADLWRIGHSLSGLYSVMGLTQVESVYCDFTKLPTDSGFQTWIGQFNVKSSPVYFYVQRSAHYTTTKTPIPFDVERLNVGGAMNRTAGKFTAPRDGIYSFSFTGFASIPASSSRIILTVYMYLNGNRMGSGQSDEAGTAYQFETFSFQSTFILQKGDEIWLEIESMATGTELYGGLFTHFSGHLLEENFAIA